MPCFQRGLSFLLFSEDIYLIPGFDRTTVKNPDEDAFSGHDTVAGLLENSTAPVALFADLGNLSHC